MKKRGNDKTVSRDIMEINKLLLAAKSLLGVAIGDAFGERFFGEESLMKSYIHQRMIPESSLDFTDDTIMAIAIFKSLEKYDEINQDFLVHKSGSRHGAAGKAAFSPKKHFQI